MRNGEGVAAHRRIRVGVQVSPQHTGWTHVRRACLEAERLGVDLVFNWDHFWPLSGDPAGEHHECWTTLGAWADATDRIEFGPLVVAAGYRNPDLVADMARTLDQISHGRFVLGLGAGFREEEYAEYDIPFGTPGQRVETLKRTIERIEHRLALLHPAPVRRIPILIAGGGERRMLPVVAQHADIWNTFAGGEDFARKSGILDEHCARMGRDPSQIERSVFVKGPPCDRTPELVELGASLFVVGMQAPFDFDDVRAWLNWRDGEG